MLLNVQDANGNVQQVIAQAQEALVDASSSIQATATSQLMLNPNATRSGWMMQNRGANPMYVNESGGVASTGPGAFQVPPGGFFPPQGLPPTTAQVNVLGTAGDVYTVREW